MNIFFNLLPDDKILALSKLKAFADNKFNVIQNIKFVFPKQQILDSSKLKEFTDDNFKFDYNGRKFSKRAENTANKGEIACYEEFLLFPQCFLKTCTADT